MLDNESDVPYNMSLKVKQLFHSIANHPTESAMKFNIAIPSVVNTLKKIHSIITCSMSSIQHYIAKEALYLNISSGYLQNLPSLTLHTQRHLKNESQTLMNQRMIFFKDGVGKPSFKK